MSTHSLRSAGLPAWALAGLVALWALPATAVTVYSVDLGAGPGLAVTVAPGSTITVSVLATVDGSVTGAGIDVGYGSGNVGFAALNLAPPGTLPAGTPSCTITPAVCRGFGALAFTPIAAGSYAIGSFQLTVHQSALITPQPNPDIIVVLPPSDVLESAQVFVPEPSSGLLAAVGLALLSARKRTRSSR